MLSIGYHIAKIEKGQYGELSKIIEECQEAQDAIDQDCSIMLTVELADIYGALEAVANKHNLTMEDLRIFSNITKRAFRNGIRS